MIIQFPINSVRGLYLLAKASQSDLSKFEGASHIELQVDGATVRRTAIALLPQEIRRTGTRYKWALDHAVEAGQDVQAAVICEEPFIAADGVTLTMELDLTGTIEVPD